MHDAPERNGGILRDLGDGLILRRGTPADADALAAFNGLIHRRRASDEPNEWVASWVRDLASGRHPTFRPGDFTIVEDRRTGAIVSSLNLISQTWTYGGVPFGVGRPEVVGTHPDFRRRGLVRAQFDVIHEWSAARGELVQAISGIPWYYRQFGYEMALSLDGARVGHAPDVPKLTEGEAEPFRVRPAAESDLPFIASVDEAASRRNLVACIRDTALWRYELLGHSQRSAVRYELRVLETPEGQPVGYLAHECQLREQALLAHQYELASGVSWLAPTPTVVRYLWSTGAEYAARNGTERTGFGFALGDAHPVYEVLADRLPRTMRSYAWYLRVPDLVGFVRRIAPVLERRLASSIAVNHTGELKLSFYRDGLTLRFDRGRLAAADRWQPTSTRDGDAAFPGHTFLQLLFGNHNLDELSSAHPDCRPGNSGTRVLLRTLFPKQPSHVWPVS